MSNPIHVTDLVPRSKRIVLMFCVLGVAVIAIFEGLYYVMPRIGRMTTDGRVAAFDLDGEGSLATWFSALLLLLASQTALLIYLLRKRHPDSLGGSHRLWIGAAACWFVMSVDERGVFTRASRSCVRS
jgi:hypothetical protein